MSKPGIVLSIGIVLAIVAVAVALLTIRAEKQVPPAPSAPEGTGNAAVGANGETSIITYSDTGFSPKNLTVTPGTTVTWSNQSSRQLQVAGANLVGTIVGNGGSYSHTFTAPGEYRYDNQAFSNDTGTITVSGDAPAAGAINPAALPE